MATEWSEQSAEGQRQAARAQALHQHRVKAAKRVRMRDLARLMLAVSMLLLGVLAVEIGRKAVTVINHAGAPAETVVG